MPVSANLNVALGDTRLAPRSSAFGAALTVCPSVSDRLDGIREVLIPPDFVSCPSDQYVGGHLRRTGQANRGLNPENIKDMTGDRRREVDRLGRSSGGDRQSRWAIRVKHLSDGDAPYSSDLLERLQIGIIRLSVENLSQGPKGDPSIRGKAPDAHVPHQRPNPGPLTFVHGSPGARARERYWVIEIDKNPCKTTDMWFEARARRRCHWRLRSSGAPGRSWPSRCMDWRYSDEGKRPIC